MTSSFTCLITEFDRRPIKCTIPFMPLKLEAEIFRAVYPVLISYDTLGSNSYEKAQAIARDTVARVREEIKAAKETIRAGVEAGEWDRRK